VYLILNAVRFAWIDFDYKGIDCFVSVSCSVAVSPHTSVCSCAGFMQRPDDFTSTLFVARITEWGEKMPMPKGSVVFV